MISIEKQNQIINSYSSGMSLTEIRGIFSFHKNTIKKVLAANGIVQRSQSDQQRINNGNGDLKQDAFDELTPESLYWIGFLYADGSISKTKGRHIIALNLNTSDEPHIKKFAEFLNSNHKIGREERRKGDKIYRTSSLQISSEKLYSSLVNLGFTEDKTYTGHVHESLLFSVDFWRGVVDGDGWVSKSFTRRYEYWWCGLCGTKHTIDCFIDFVKHTGSLTNIEDARQFESSPTTYQTAFVNKIGFQIARLLYKNSILHLDRKYEAFLKWEIDIENEERIFNSTQDDEIIRILDGCVEKNIVKIIYTIKQSEIVSGYKSKKIGVNDLISSIDLKLQLQVVSHKNTTLLCKVFSGDNIEEYLVNGNLFYKLASYLKPTKNHGNSRTQNRHKTNRKNNALC